MAKLLDNLLQCSDKGGMVNYLGAWTKYCTCLVQLPFLKLSWIIAPQNLVYTQGAGLIIKCLDSINVPGQ